MKKSFFSIDWRSFALFLATTLCCLLFLEIFMRWYIFGSNAWSYSQMKSVRHVGQSGLLQASSDLDVLWELRPNLDTNYKLWPFKTNSNGLRDKEYELSKPADTIRIAVIGDSFTMGEGIAIEDAYHSLLEERFNAAGDGKKFDFINFGVAGYSFVQYLGTIRRKVAKFHPDMILMGFCAANDSKVPNMEAFTKPYVVKPTINGFFHFHSLELLGDIYKDHYKKFLGRYSGYNADEKYVDQQFSELAKLTAELNIPLVVAYIDNKGASSDLDMVKNAANKYGYEFIDGTVNFAHDLSSDHIIYLTDNHPNAAANRIFADTIFPALRSTSTFKKLIQ